jgi:Ser/Thr protein kinase RdoA (MazF antagonist)
MSERPSAVPTTPQPPEVLVHGMSPGLVAPDWAPLAPDEVQAVLARYPIDRFGEGRRAGRRPVITWHSPRPMSSAGLVRCGNETLFVKRHDVRARTAAQLLAEHAFAAHLRAGGIPVPAVLHTLAGGTVVETGDVVYEVHEAAAGLDLYRDTMSWAPYTSLGHVRAAGTALARLHESAAGFDWPARPMGVLTTSSEVLTAPDPVERVRRLVQQRPGLAGYLAHRDWEKDFGRHLLPFVSRAAPLLRALGPRWAHGDWHPSNLGWTSPGPLARVASVFDFGLANRTSTAHDLATALERSTISWLELSGSGRAEADFDAVDALLAGYEAHRRLETAELAALAEVLPVVHLEYALSEVEYFAAVTGSPGNAGLAYDTYLIGHARWFEGPAGTALIEHLRQRATTPAGR